MLPALEAAAVSPVRLSSGLACRRVTTREAGITLLACRVAELDPKFLGQPHGILSPDELVRWQDLALRQDRDQFAAGRLLLRSALASVAPHPARWTLIVGANGRPEVDWPWPALPAPSFNLSHAGGMVMCALSATRTVGIDLERIGRPPGPELEQTVLTAHERLDLEALPARDRELRFLQFWTLKEAYAKALGIGLALEPASLEVRLTNPPSLRRSGRLVTEWQFEQWLLDDQFVVTLCHISKTDVAAYGATLETKIWRARNDSNVRPSDS